MLAALKKSRSVKGMKKRLCCRLYAKGLREMIKKFEEKIYFEVKFGRERKSITYMYLEDVDTAL